MKGDMNKTDILKMFKVSSVEEQKKIIKDFIQDETNSFEDRKEVWLNTPPHLYLHQRWIVHLNEYEAKYGEIFWYDDFYIDHRQTAYLIDIVNKIAEENLQEKVDAFIANCMKLGVHSFVHDW